MEVVHTIREVREHVDAARKAGKRIGFVPTMGALHAGHGRLVEVACQKTDYVVVSIFVNPLQFGPTEDLDRYPRTLASDAKHCRKLGADLVFAPAVEEMYPSKILTFVNVEEVTTRLCGAKRPGHFRGVATVVTKLFNIVLPDTAFFGQKDAQQVAVIKRMVADLSSPVEINVVPTVREDDGLAMSSRNTYLKPEDREAAPILNISLQAALQKIEEGERKADRVRQFLRESIGREPRALIDYVDVVDPDTMQPLDELSGRALLLVAVYFGATRLIDNAVYEQA